ncbi:APC family permease [Fructilactobacillus sp. Tb1]|uniref:APC family permease n=1 Tax=Fructilactobacillus sp. Tb1 TaxID=3422304 RepID=UPI003D2D2A28
MSLVARMFQKEELSTYLDNDKHLNRTLTVKDLLGLGIGAVIGTGIFILPGTVAATTTGPAVVISFLLAAVVCALVAMAYGEFSATLPVAGSAYSYGNIVFGEVVGWVLGWALILEYFLAVAAVATGWSAYFTSLISPIIKLPKAFTGAFDPAHGTYGNLVAILVILVIAFSLRKGMTTSKKTENLLVLLKLAIILIFIVVGFFYIKSSNYHPFIPKRMHDSFGFQGVLTGAAMVFFSFLGFDALSGSAAEVKNPSRNLPLGIIGTLVIAAVLYSLVAFVLVGMVNYTQLNVADPVSFALHHVGQNAISMIIAVGALIGMYTMMYATIYSSSRLIYAIGRDGLLPGKLGQINKNGVPTRALIISTVIIAVFAGLIPLDKLVDLVSFGTLLAFTVVSLGIIPLRKRKDIKHNGFKMPGYPVLPIIATLFSLSLMTQLHVETLITAGIWFLIGIIIYLVYGIHHSTLNRD